MGLIAGIYRGDLGDCSNGGISGYAKGVCLMNVDGPFSPDDRYAPALLVAGNISGAAKIVPATEVDGEFVEVRNGVGPMFGGTYVGSSDSRFGEAVRKLTGGPCGAVPLHDRFETQAQYDANFN